MEYTKCKLVCNPLRSVYFGDLVTKILHFSPLKTNNSAQLGTLVLNKVASVEKGTRKWVNLKKYKQKPVSLVVF